MLTIVMYHYVRDLLRTKFPRIKALLTSEFEGQLDHIARKFTVVGEPAVRAAWRDGADLPQDACWLTFDDGYIDHFDTVLPRLVERGWPASFFPCSGPVFAGRLLDVHRIQFILAATDDVSQLPDALDRELDGLRACGVSLPAPLELRGQHYQPNAWDGPDVNYFKRLLQVALPESVRTEIAGKMFQRFVTMDERAFAADLYMTVEQMRQMTSAGMSFGGHGHWHRWMGRSSLVEQTEEIEQSVRLIERIGPCSGWTMCYPYGSYNADTLRLLAGAGAALGITTMATPAMREHAAMELPRLDTRHLPCRA